MHVLGAMHSEDASPARIGVNYRVHPHAILQSQFQVYFVPSLFTNKDDEERQKVKIASCCSMVVSAPFLCPTKKGGL
jgi:hypothetical protein